MTPEFSDLGMAHQLSTLGARGEILEELSVPDLEQLYKKLRLEQLAIFHPDRKRSHVSPSASARRFEAVERAFEDITSLDPELLAQEVNATMLTKELLRAAGKARDMQTFSSEIALNFACGVGEMALQSQGTTRGRMLPRVVKALNFSKAINSGSGGISYAEYCRLDAAVALERVKDKGDEGAIRLDRVPRKMQRWYSKFPIELHIAPDLSVGAATPSGMARYFVGFLRLESPDADLRKVGLATKLSSAHEGVYEHFEVKSIAAEKFSLLVPHLSFRLPHGLECALVVSCGMNARSGTPDFRIEGQALALQFMEGA